MNTDSMQLVRPYLFQIKQHDEVHASSLIRSISRHELFYSEKLSHYQGSALRFLHEIEAGVLSEDEGGVLNFYNLASEKIFGYHASEALGMPSINLVPAHLREGREKLFERVLLEGAARDIITQRIHKSRKLINIVADVFSYQLEDKKTIAAIVRLA